MKNKLLTLVTSVVLFLLPILNFGQAPNLGAASGFALFTAAGAFTNTGASVVTGDIGTYVGALTGFPPGTVNGQFYYEGSPLAQQAAAAVNAAYTDLSGRTCGTVLATPFGNGQILTPGVYCIGSAATLNGELILDGQGNPDALFIIQIGGAFATSSYSTITLINAASLDNVFWQIGGAFTLGQYSVFKGTVVADGQIELLEGSSLYGRGLTRAGAILLHNNNVNIASPPNASIITANGPTTFCAGGSVILSGNIGGVWNTGETTESITVTTSGDYFVTNTNEFGTVISNHIIVTVNPLPSAPMVSTIQPGCLVSTGTITITSPIGAGITYSIGGAYQQSTVFNLVLPNTYTVTAKSSDGCISPGTLVTINPALAAPSAPVASTIQPTCLISTGTITVTSPIGAGITYSIGGAYQQSLVFNLVLPNTYTVTAKSADGCISPGTFVTINPAPGAPSAPVASTIQPTCLISTGTITVTSPIGAGITYSIGGAYQQSTVFNLVLPNTYTVTAMSSDGCISPGTLVTINPAPAAPSAPVASTIQPTCLISTGTITVTSPIGAGITYSIGGAFQQSTVFNLVLPNTYTVTAKSSDGCISPGTLVTINPAPAAPSAPVASTIQPTCLISTGTITVTSPIGAGITYSIGGAYQQSTVFSLVLPNTYTVTAKSSAGCISPGTFVTINPAPGAPSAPVASTIQPTCLISTGTITVTSPIGAGITYSIGGAYQQSTVFNLVLPNTYTVTAMGSDGCISPGTLVTINPAPEAPSAPMVSTIQPSCVISTGTITVTSPIGAGITYSIGGAYQQSTVFSLVLPNTYTVTAKSPAGCISPGTSVTINPAPAAPSAPVASTIQPTCLISTGTITVTSPIGAGITYSIGGAYQQSTVFNLVLPNTYTVTAKSSAGCISPGTFVTINLAPGAPSAPVASTIQPTCLISTGTITVTSPIGAGITYSIGGAYQQSTVFNLVLPDTYTATAKSSDGCISPGTLVTINFAPAAPSAPVASTIQPTCLISTGTITVTSPIGAGITYSIGGAYQQSPVFNLVLPNTYTVTAKSSDGCLSPGTLVTINPAPAAPSAPVASTIQPTCLISTGTITVTSPIGAGITYSIGGAYQQSTVFNLVLPNTYTVTAKSSDGCISPGTFVTINPAPGAPSAPVASTIQPTCLISTGTITVTSPIGAGITYSIGGAYQQSTVFNLVLPNTYTVTAMSSDGCISPGTLVTIIPAPEAPSAPMVSTIQPGCLISTGTITVTSPIGAGITYSIGGAYQQSPVFNLVLPNTYTVTAKSPDGCISPGTLVIINPAPAAPSAPVASTIQPTCLISTGTITVTTPIGAGITYSIGGAYQQSTVFNLVLPNTYTVTAKSSDGCISPGTFVTINPAPGAPSAPMVSIIQPNCLVSTGTIIIASPIGAGITYSIGGAYQQSRVFNLLLPNTYTVTAKSSEGCISPGTPVTINPAPEAPLAPMVSTIQPTCLISTGTITVTSPIGAGITYSIGGAYQQSTVFDLVLPNIYMVTAKGSDGCISPGTPVTINPAPEAPIASIIVANGPTTICEGDIIILSGNVGGIWNTGEITPSISVSTEGDFFVTNTNECGTVISNIINVSFNSAPMIIIEPISQVSCLEGSVSFTVLASGTGLTYQWRKGTVNLTDGGNISGSQTATLTINPVSISDMASNYNVIVSGICGTVVISVNVALEVYTTPIACVTVCEGETVRLSTLVTGIGLSYQWRKGTENLVNGGNISGANSVMLTIDPVNMSDAATNYNVVIYGRCLPFEVSNDICVDVIQLPVPTIAGLNSVLQGTTDVLYTTESGMMNYVWNISAGGIITSGQGTNSILVSWLTPGNQSVDVTYSNEYNCSAATATIYEVIVNPLPVVECPEDFEVCVNAQVFQLTGGMPAGGNYSGTGVIFNTYFDPATAGPGAHEITYTGDINGYISSCTFIISVIDLTAVNCPDDFSVCINAGIITLDQAIPVGGVYEGNGVYGDLFNPMIAGLGDHLVTYQFTDSNGCTNTCNFLITVDEAPDVNCPSGFSVCISEPEFILEGATPIGGNYSINGVPENVFNPSANGEGLHLIHYSFTDINGCSAICEFVIQVLPLPIVELGQNDTLLCTDFELNVPKPYQLLSSVSGYGTIVWTSNGTGTLVNPNIPNPIYTFSGQDILIGSVTFTLTAQSAGICSVDVSDQITVVIPSQLIDIPAGWSGISSYITPFDQDIVHVTNPCIEELIVQVSIGGVYWPEQNVNTLISWSPVIGYKVKYSQPCCLPIFGEPVTWPSTVHLNIGVNYIPVHSPMPVKLTDVFGADTTKIILLVDIYTLQVYNPDFGILNTLEYLEPGIGYLAYMSLSANITYPIPTKNMSSNMVLPTREPFQVSNHTAWNDVSNTGTMHFISIEKTALTDLDLGDYVGAFSSDGTCAGMVEFMGGDRMILPVFGNDPFTNTKEGMNEGEFINLRLYRNYSGEVFDISATYDPNAPNSNGLFAGYGLSRIILLTVGITSIDDPSNETIIIFPNPSSTDFTIRSSFNIDNISLVKYDGQILYSEHVEKSNEYILNISKYAHGVYFIIVKSNTGLITNRRVIIQ